MKILIFGGTTEGRILAETLTARGDQVTVSVATVLGAEELQNIPCKTVIGRLDAAQMTELVREFALVIDGTHPYAEIVSRNIRKACEVAQVPLRRVLREPSAGADCVRVDSCAQAAEYLQGKPGNVLIATGSKELRAYAGLEPNRLFPRVLPTHEALDICEELRIPHRNILALQGPFSVEMNAAMLTQYHIRYLVTKDGGRAGGFWEKQEAAQRTGTELILVGRPQDSGLSMEALLEELEVQET